MLVSQDAYKVTRKRKIYKRERVYLNSIAATRGKNLFEGVERALNFSKLSERSCNYGLF